ncbi:MAG TPA: hypothetical protein VIM71_00865 [Lacunisphaera sp.]
MSNSHSSRTSNRSRMLLALACALGLTLMSVPAAIAAEAPAKQPAADKAPALPVSATFEKVASTEGTPFVLKLKNDSHDTLKISGKVLLSVVHHAMDKARVLPEHTLEAGKVWSIPGLSAEDKVILNATGFAPLELVVH